MPDGENTTVTRTDSKLCAHNKKPPRRSIFSVLFNSNKQQQQQTKMPSARDSSVNNNTQFSSLDIDESKEEEEEDPDSYELELSERIQLEKDRDLMSSSPASRWSHNNSSSVHHQAYGKSPLLEEFINSHRILLDCSSSSEEDEHEVSVKGSNWAAFLANSPRTLWSANSPPSSDSEFELLDCESPALAVNCSDDTSCSSVELIWSRAREPEPAQQPDFQASPRWLESPALSSERFTPAVLDCNESLQRLSILELAKPSRAKNRFRIAAPTTVKETRSDNNNSVHWVANPLFSSEEELKRCESCENEIDSQKRDLQEAHSPIPIIMSPAKDEELENLNISDEQLDEKSSMKKRWSVRGKSPFNITRDNIYLNQLMNSLGPKKIRSNVSSITNQLSLRLSDTGKRASILADQFIASIRDTTKDRSSGDEDNSFQQDSFSTIKSDQSDKSKQLFSLIYLHQQQANGQQVITRQPKPVQTNLTTLTTPPPAPLLPQINETIATQQPSMVKQDDNNGSSSNQAIDNQYCRRTIQSAVEQRSSAAEMELDFHSDVTGRSSKLLSGKPRKRARRRRHINKATFTSSESDNDEEMGEKEYVKLSHSRSTGGGHRTRLRSLNYWRRYGTKNQISSADKNHYK